MEMPGRKYQAGSGYRYGFNGKENDNEVKGEGNQQDYGMRIYDPRVGKFLTIDPIAAKYPYLTPYQFSSNSPISGVDLDGLEYLTAIYNVTIQNGQNKVTAEYVWNNNLTHNEHGNLGIGVNYQVKISNLDNKTTTSNKYFVSRGGTSDMSYITQYGNYMGSNPLPNFNAYTGSPIANTFRYDIPAVDYVDQQAKLHDQGYDRVKAVGSSGLFSDWATTPYDEAASSGWKNYLDNYKRETSIDPVNNQPVRKQALDAAWRGYQLFSLVVGNKKSEISNFMLNNYAGEAKYSSYSMKYGKMTSSGDREHNYQLFLNKYMEKKDGNWVRKDDMWNTDSKGNYTTPKTSKQSNDN